MTIMDTKHSDADENAASVAHLDFAAGTIVASDVAAAPAPTRFARFLTALRAGADKDRRTIFAAEPMIYEEYRATLARRNASRKLALRD